ncbi:hypothetical protein [Kordiimonas pumila]|uniref:DUF3892 domain-containing protein n=1 Tax=Kordiimonas pumila TaxID=2161677 RepID=A0ABV7D6V5_9PROT|nr:hypothetical protein [Kordiimonas pumila]
MVQKHKVLFVRTDAQKPPSHQVTHIGGTMPDGTPWSISAEEAISSIQSGRFAFFMHREDQGAERIVVAHNPVYGAFLRAENDRQMPKRLMQLPEIEQNNHY